MPSSGQKRSQPLKVAVVADSGAAAQQIAFALQRSGYWVRPISLALPNAHERVRGLRPSAVLVRATARWLPSAAGLSRAVAAAGAAVVLLTPTASQAALEAALEAGAMLHLVEPVTAHALAAAVNVATARAQDLRDLYAQHTELRESARARRVVDRAKAVLMRRFGFTEEEAHRRLQVESRSRNRKLIETAWHVIRADADLSRHRQGAAR